MKSIFWIWTICHVIHGSAEGSAGRLTRRSAGSVLSSQQPERPHRLQSASNNRSVVEGDQESDPSSHSIRLLPPPDMIIDSFLNSPHAQLVSQRNSPPKEVSDSMFRRLNSDTGSRNSRRLPPTRPQSSPPSSPRQPYRHQRPSHHRAASLTGASLRDEIVPLMPPLDQLQKHVIPIDAISKDIESAIQKIVEDIVNRREKIFYQLPNNMYDKPAPDRERRPKKKRQKEEAMRQRPVPYSARPPLRHLPPPPAAHRGLYSAASSPGSNQPAANTQPYYAIAKNGLGAGLKSLADYVKSLRPGNRDTESENEGFNYLSLDGPPSPRGQNDRNIEPAHATTPVSSFMIEIPDGLDLPVPDPLSPVTPAHIRQYEPKGEELTLLHSDWVGVHSEENAEDRKEMRRPERDESRADVTGRERNAIRGNGYQEPAALIDSGSGSGSGRRGHVASSADPENLSGEQIRINKELLLPLFESILGESNNRIGVYIPKPSLTTSLPSSPQPSSRSQQPAENHSSLMRGGATTATTSYSSGMTGIRKKKPCPGR